MSSQHPSGLFISVLRFAAVPTAPGCARAFVRQTLRTWRYQQAAEPAASITTELVTNAVKATGTTDPHPTYAALAAVPIIRVRLSLHGGNLIIGVWDTSPHTPILQWPSEDAEDGRGLLIVHAQSTRWGTTYFPKTGGKVVWAEIALRHADTPPDATPRPTASAPLTAQRVPSGPAATA
jgi:anti-sigma regulatory factor (Ser/Thr protein kinase)